MPSPSSFWGYIADWLGWGGDASPLGELQYTGRQLPAPRDRSDTIANDLSGMGVSGRDKRLDARPRMQALLTDDEVEALQMHDVARAVIMRPVHDAIGNPDVMETSGWRTDAGKERDVTAKLDADLRLHAVLRDSLCGERWWGGGLIMFAVDDAEGVELDDPLPAGPHTLRAVHFIQANEADPVEWERDPRSTRWLVPSVWLCRLRRDGVDVPPFRLHASRCFYLPGAGGSKTRTQNRRGFGVAMADVYWPSLRDLDQLHASATLAGMELSTPWIKLAAAKPTAAGNDSVSAKEQLRVFQRLRSMLGLSVLSVDDEIGRDNVSVRGMEDLLKAGWERVAMVENIPLRPIRATAGFSDKDVSGDQDYERLVADIQAAATRILVTIYTLALGPGERTVQWSPLFVPSAKDAADTYKVRAEAGAALVNALCIPAEAVMRQFSGPEVLPYPVILPGDELPEPEPVDTGAEEPP